MTVSIQELDDFLSRNGLTAQGEVRQCIPLTGGVSSDIWRVDLANGESLCIKRALATLKVAAHWQAPVSRNAYEWAWLQFAAQVTPDAVPAPLAHDENAGLFAMGFLPPERYPVWKAQLMDGQVDPEFATAIGTVLGALHQASAKSPQLAARFDTTDNFYALRLEPYLLTTAQRHPSLAATLQQLADTTANHRTALVHGDVSPKNILAGPNGPVFLDAECAWWGDPAFDLAFCLNHLLLKAVIHPERGDALRQSFRNLVSGYFEHLDFESPAALENRAAALLPALLLARVDGKSPVEYITRDGQRNVIRRAATAWLEQPPATLPVIADSWFSAKQINTLKHFLNQ